MPISQKCKILDQLKKSISFDFFAQKYGVSNLSFLIIKTLNLQNSTTQKSTVYMACRKMFAVSKNWLKKFKKRNEICQLKITGKKLSNYKPFQNQFMSIIKEKD